MNPERSPGPGLHSKPLGIEPEEIDNENYFL